MKPIIASPLARLASTRKLSRSGSNPSPFRNALAEGARPVLQVFGCTEGYLRGWASATDFTLLHVNQALPRVAQDQRGSVFGFNMSTATRSADGAT